MHPTHNIRGQIIDDATINQDPVIPFHRSEDCGNGHSGSQGLGQRAPVKNESFARDKISGHAAEGNWKIVKGGDFRVPQGFAAQQQRQLLAGIDAGWERQPLAKPQRVLSGDAVPLLFLSDGTVFKLRGGAEQVTPFCMPRNILDIGSIMSGCI